MTSPELHADDLLDREARGALTSEERGRLESHLAVCSVCRFERAVRADFKAEFEALGQSRPGDGRVLHAPPPRPSAWLPRRSRLRPLAMVAVAVLLAGAAGAELSGRGFLTSMVRAWTAPAASSATGVMASRAPAHSRVHAPKAAPSAVNQPAASSTEVPPEPPSSSEPARDTLAAPEAPKAATPVPAPLPVLPAASASTLFDEARQARELGDYSVAVERYTRLLALFPSSPQAITTRAVLGRLLLDRGEPRAALEQFDAYLGSGSTTLAEETLLGRALAFGRLGQLMQEATAWQALLSAYPNSLHASRAHDRLRALHAE